jgi:hypothetical protein
MQMRKGIALNPKPQYLSLHGLVIRKDFSQRRIRNPFLITNPCSEVGKTALHPLQEFVIKGKNENF